ncbi:hypothetical protein ZWY2020_010914 [Hordeum vulgare]|nr:hypothetical protein ZWY2020_010914 [Hordeum vulgare]
MRGVVDETIQGADGADPFGLEGAGDIQKLYQEDRVKAAAADGLPVQTRSNELMEQASLVLKGRRPGLDRKRPHISVNVDFSQLHSIDDPEEYFLTLERLEKADMEIKKLRRASNNKSKL